MNHSIEEDIRSLTARVSQLELILGRISAAISEAEWQQAPPRSGQVSAGEYAESWAVHYA